MSTNVLTDGSLIRPVTFSRGVKNFDKNILPLKKKKKKVDWGQKRRKKKVNFLTLLPLREPTSGSHHSDLRARSGQWAAPFKKLSEADVERVQ